MADVPAAGAYEYLRTQAIARLYLDNIANIQSSWVTQGPKIRLGRLGKTVRRPDGRVIDYDDVVEGIAAWLGVGRASANFHHTSHHLVN